MSSQRYPPEFKNEAIRKAQRNGNMLEIMLPAGVLTTIFLGNNSAQAAYNIHSTDWAQLSEAMTYISPMFGRELLNSG